MSNFSTLSKLLSVAAYVLRFGQQHWLANVLRLFQDDTGLICCGGRIHNAPVSESAKFSCLLPPKDPFRELVIRDTHIRQLHAGVNSTLTTLRLRYWIAAERQHVKKAICHCVTRKKISGLPFDIPDLLPLPKRTTYLGSCSSKEAYI